MGLTPKLIDDLLGRGYSRRQVARIALGASAVVPFFNEFAQAQQSEAAAGAAAAVVAAVDLEAADAVFSILK